MVGKTYLRYVDGPQGGAVAGRASLSLGCIVGHATYTPATATSMTHTPRVRGQSSLSQQQQQQSPPLSMLFVPSLEAVRVYAARSGELLHTLVPAEAKLPVEVTALHVVSLDRNNNNSAAAAAANTTTSSSSSSSSSTAVASAAAQEQGWLMLVGYSNGYVAAFACSAANNYGKPLCRFYAMGHRSDTKVLALALGSQRVRGCSAGQDTDVTVYDLVSHEATFRLRGHRGGVVGVAFVAGATSTRTTTDGAAAGGGDADDDEVLVSAAADGLVKVWNLTLRQCVQTVVASDTQVTSMVLDAAGRRLYCGMRESFLRVYNTEGLRRLSSSSYGNGNNNNNDNDNGTHAAATVVSPSVGGGGLVEHGVLPRKFHKPVTVLQFAPDGAYLLACTSKTVEVYGVLSAEEVHKKVQRKRKRRRAHVDAEGNEVGEDATAHVHNNEDDDKHDAQQHHRGDGNGGTATATRTARDASVHATAAEEVVLLRTFFFTDKVRSAVFVPAAPTRTRGSSSSSGSGAAALVGASAALQHPHLHTQTLHIAVTFNNNNIHVYTTTPALSDATGTAARTLTDLHLRYSTEYKGHHSDVRRLCFVDGDAALLSLSAERVALWTLRIHSDRVDCDHLGDGDYYDAREAAVARVEFRGTLLCAGGVAVTAATCMAAVSSSLCCVGSQDGALRLLDVASSRELACVTAAHVGEVKDVTLRGTDAAAFISVGADRRLVLWSIGVVEGDGSDAPHDADNKDDDDDEEHEDDATDDGDADKTRQRSSSSSGNKTKTTTRPPRRVRSAEATPMLLAAHEVELSELPLFVRDSGANGRFIGVGLHNHTVQLFFADTLKPYLSLFGHKLPPTAMAFSTDAALVATVGVDKALRFWGTDYGDCHRALHAHDDAVTAVAFQADTHYAFTVGLDAALKMWDGDNGTMVQQFRHHPRALWCVAVTQNGTLLVAAGADACLRCHVRTQDIVFPHEEEERAAQQAMDEEAARRAAAAQMDRVTAGEQSNGGGGGVEAGVAGQPTVRTAEAAEQLMEALDLVSVEQQRQHNLLDTTTQRHPLLRNCTEYEYLWSVLDAIRPSELRHALSALTSVHVDALLDGLAAMLRQGVVHNYETAAKVLLALLMPVGCGGGGAQQAVMATALRTTALRGEQSEAHAARRLAALRRDIAAGLHADASQMDYNIAGLNMVRAYLQDTEHIRFFDLSAIQGHKKRYHARVLPGGAGGGGSNATTSAATAATSTRRV